MAIHMPYIHTEWAGRARARRAQGSEGEEGESSASTRERRNLSSAVVHYWNDAAAAISYLRDALLVHQLLPTSYYVSELTDDG